jgi:hypothetical protein
VIFHKSDIGGIPFSLMWGGFAIFWEFGVTHQTHNAAARPDLFLTLWGIPFVVMGQYFIWGRFLHAAWGKTHTYYALTNKRVLVVRLTSSRKVVEGFLGSGISISMDERSNGFGSIEFSPDPTYDAYSARRKGRPNLLLDFSRLAFYDIPSVREVYEAVRGARERSTDPSETLINTRRT